MADRTARMTLWITSATCLILAIGAVGFTLSKPPAFAMPPSVRAKPSWITPPPAEAPASLSQAEFAKVWHKPMQSPLVAPVKKTVLPAVNPPTPRPKPILFQGQLIGTLVDSDPSMARAWLLHKQEKRMVAAGQILDDWPGKPVVKSISDRHVDMTINGELVSLAIAKHRLQTELSHGD